MLIDPSGSDEFLRTPVDADANADDRQQQAQARESFWMALNNLPEEHRTVILLRQQMDLSFVEIAERMHQRTEAVQTLWSQAIMVLGEKLDERK